MKTKMGTFLFRTVVLQRIIRSMAILRSRIIRQSGGCIIMYGQLYFNGSDGKVVCSHTFRGISLCQIYSGWWYNSCCVLHINHPIGPSTHSSTVIYCTFFFFFLISLIADGPHHYHPACGHKGSSHLSPVHVLQFFIAMQVQHSYNSSTNGY